MRTTWRAGALVGVGLLVLVLGVASVGLLRGPEATLPRRPSSIATPGPVADQLGIERSLVASVSVGRITELLPAGFGADHCPLAVGERGAAWLAAPGCDARTVAFATPGSDVGALDWDDDGEVEFLSRGSWAREPRLFDVHGEVLWRFERGERNAVNDTALLRQSDGSPLFVIGFNGDGGIAAFSEDGEERWRRETGNVWQVAIVDADGDGRDEILHTDACGCLNVLDLQGELLKRSKPTGYLSEFSVLTWGGRPALLHPGDGRLLLLGPDGETRQELSTPIGFELADPHGLALELAGDEVLVSLLSSSSYDRSALNIHDSSGNLRYAEVLPGPCDAVAAAGERELWIGCGERIHRYRWHR